MKSSAILIGITDCSKFLMYQNWLQAVDNVQVIRLSPAENNAQDATKCHGIVLSGGEDVHPRYYNKLEYLPYCQEIDERRDDFEFEVLDIADKQGAPLLGICRGLQVANVFYGGTLIPDIPSFGRFNHSRYSNDDRYHAVTVDPSSELGKIAGVTNGEINSAHHQSAELIGRGLVANAISADGVVEGIERKEAGKNFFQLVQWHPERMKELGNPFSHNIKMAFVNAAKNR
jgi:putative glutamine amidotransferase